MMDHQASSDVDMPSAAIARHDQALWRALTAPDSDVAFYEAWLGLTCRMVPGALSGMLQVPAKAANEMPLLVAWPPGHRPESSLAEAAQVALQAGRGTVQPVSTKARSASRLAYPVQLGDAAIAVVALEVSESSGQDVRQAMRHVQWAAAWLRDYRRGKEQAASRLISQQMELALDLLAAAMEERGFKSACRVTATELATRFDCERVSIGFRNRQQTEVVGISHSAQFGRSMNLVRLLGAAMDEALDQQSPVLYPPLDNVALVSRAHEALAAAQSAGFVLTIPMFVRDHFIGAVTFERARGSDFDQTSIDLAEAVVAILGPALLDKQEVDRPLVMKVAVSAANLAVRLFGPGHWAYKIGLSGCVAAVFFGLVARGPYRIAAEAQVEGTIQRAVVAPFDGFVAEADLKAGDTVQAGQQIAALDDRDLNLERLRWVTERQQHLAEYEQAFSLGKRADAARFKSLADEASAQTRLLDEELSRTRLVAPFAGLIVSGDLSQSIGAPVRRGDALFEVAPLDDYRVVLWVNESQIADVVSGQSGSLLVTALPDVSLPLTIKRVTPVAEVHDGHMVFQVDATLGGVSPRLRPRMEGLAKIDAGTRRLVWIWFRSLLQWARVQTFAWLSE